MSIFVGYTSAYEYWRTSDLPRVSASSRVRPSKGARVDGRAASRLVVRPYSAGDGRLHLVVAGAADRCRTGDCVCHVWSGPVPAGSYLKVDEELFVSSPAMSFVQSASELSLIELVRYGYVLCSSYAYAVGEEEGFRKREPLATAKALERFIEKTCGLRGEKKARRALRFVRDGSASPMETNLVMALCLPRMLGGYGIELPELNPRIAARSGGLVARDHFACDLYWKKHRVAVEYDSREHHSGNDAETRDSARRSALLAQGITVVTITPEQFFDARKLDEAARAVAKLTGTRLPANEAGWMMRRHDLRAELLSDMRR